MPYVANENLSRVSWSSNESIHAGSNTSGSRFQSPSSSYSTSPTSSSPNNTLRKKPRKTTSLNNITREHFLIKSDVRDSRSQSPALSYHEEEETDFLKYLTSILGWYPCLLLRLLKAIIVAIIPRTWKQLVLALPMLWISVWLWLLTNILKLPLTIFKILLSLTFAPGIFTSKTSRTVLISGGSTIQALHLARNFYSTGARVIVCETDDLFSITMFSTAVSKFYNIPKPSSEQQQNYVRALCEIVDKEQVTYYVPVSATTSAYYDAIAKPHLELLGCTCFCPGIKEVWILDDMLEMLKRCQKYEIPTPPHYVVTSKENIMELYHTGAIRRGVHVMLTAGARGLRERSKILLPLSRHDLKIPNDISEQRPWVIIQNMEGDHYVTCTTIKNSRVIANVTCKTDEANNNLVSVENQEINEWLINFFSKLQLLRSVSGHISFRFVHCRDSGIIFPLNTQVGISLPYICYTNLHPRLVWKPCKHARQNSGVENGVFQNTVIVGTKLVDKVLDKREALFAIWDPLPYCAYYHLKLPFKNVLGFLKRRQDTFPRPITRAVR